MADYGDYNNRPEDIFEYNCQLDFIPSTANWMLITILRDQLFLLEKGIDKCLYGDF